MTPNNYFLRLIALHIFSLIILVCFQYKSIGQCISAKMDVKIGLPTNYIFQTAEDLDGNIWMGTDKGLLHLSKHDIIVYDNDNLLDGNYVKNVICLGRRYVVFTSLENGLCIFDRKFKKVNKFFEKHAVVSIIGASENSFLVSYYADKIGGDINIAEFDTSGKLMKIIEKNKDPFSFYNTRRREVVKLNSHENKDFFIKALNYNQIPNAYFFNKEYDVISLNSVFHIFKNKKLVFKKNYTLCLHPISNGVIYKDKLFINCIKSINSIDLTNAEISLLDKSNEITDISDISVGKDGKVMVSTLGKGLVIYEFRGNKLLSDIRGIRSFKQIGEHIYWLGEEYIYHTTLTKLKEQCETSYDKYFVGPNVKAFDIRNDTLVYGNFDGLFTNRIENNSLKKIQVLKKTAGISGIHFHKNGVLYATYGAGVYYYSFDKKDVKIANEAFVNIEKTFLYNKLYALSYEKGFYSLDVDKNLVHQYNKSAKLSSNKVNYIYEEGDISYVATKMGVDVLKSNQIIDSYQSFDKDEIIYIFRRKENIYSLSKGKLFHFNNGKLIHINKILLDRNPEINAGFYLPQLDQLLISNKNGMKLISLSSIDFLTKNIRLQIGNLILNKEEIEKKESLSISDDYTQMSFQVIFPDSIFSSDYTVRYSTDMNIWKDVGQDLTVQLPNLKQGEYSLAIKYISPDGKESEVQDRINLVVLSPFYQRWYMIGLYILLSSLATFFGINWYKERQKIKAQELSNKLEQERQRISRELHDNIGAYSTAIIENVNQLKSTSQNSSQLDNLQNNAKEILQNLRETIWLLNNKEVTTKELSAEIVSFAAKILQNYDHIDLEVVEKISENKSISGIAYMNIIRIAKEAIQNSVKHSDCSKISYSIFDDANLKIIVSDNGVGFNIENTSSNGFGISNMQERAKDIGAKLTIENRSGCKVLLEYNN